MNKAEATKSIPERFQLWKQKLAHHEIFLFPPKQPKSTNKQAIASHSLATLPIPSPKYRMDRVAAANEAGLGG